MNRILGISDQWFSIGDSLVLTVLSQVQTSFRLWLNVTARLKLACSVRCFLRHPSCYWWSWLPIHILEYPHHRGLHQISSLIYLLSWPSAPWKSKLFFLPQDFWVIWMKIAGFLYANPGACSKAMSTWSWGNIVCDFDVHQQWGECDWWVLGCRPHKTSGCDRQQFSKLGIACAFMQSVIPAATTLLRSTAVRDWTASHSGEGRESTWF